MPITYQIDPKQNLIRTTATGVLTDADILAMKRQMLEDPDFRPGMRELTDVRAIEKLAVTTEGVRRMVEHDQQNRADISSHRLAIVVSEEAAYGMSRMYQTMTETAMEHVGVFRSMEEAKKWLGI